MRWGGGFCFRKLSGHNYEELIGCAGSANQSVRSCRRLLLVVILFAHAWLRLAAAQWRRRPALCLLILRWACLLKLRLPCSESSCWLTRPARKTSSARPSSALSSVLRLFAVFILSNASGCFGSSRG